MSVPALSERRILSGRRGVLQLPVQPGLQRVALSDRYNLVQNLQRSKAQRQNLHIQPPSLSVSPLSKDLNECLSEPCKHGGTCEDQPGSYVCHCPQGFRGHDCELGTDAPLHPRTLTPQVSLRVLLQMCVCVCVCVCRAGRLRVRPVSERRRVSGLQARLSVPVQGRILRGPVPNV